MLSKEFVATLEELKGNKYDFSGVDIMELTTELIEHIGVLDSYQRDELIYPVLAHLLHDDVHQASDLAHFTKVLMSDEYLFYDMMNQEEYSVLKRSFSILQLVILIYKHNQNKILETNYFQELVTRFIRYYMEEKDYRGYLREVGFLHSIAHSADLFAQIVQNEEIKVHTIEVILEVMKDKFKTHSYMFVHDEDERSVTALEKAIRRDVLSKEFLIEYVRNFARIEKGNLYPEAYNILRNVKCFLRSLYFRFLENENYQFLVDEIKIVLKEVK